MITGRPTTGLSSMARRASDRWTALAVVAAVLSLGLPWGSAGSGSYLPGFYTPGFCTTVYDYDGWASSDCSLGYVSPGFWIGDGGAVGAQHPARLFIVAMVMLTIYGWRYVTPAATRTAAAVGLVGVLAFGLQPATGQLALAVAVVAVGLSLRRRGLGVLPPRG